MGTAFMRHRRAVAVLAASVAPIALGLAAAPSAHAYAPAGSALEIFLEGPDFTADPANALQSGLWGHEGPGGAAGATTVSSDLTDGGTAWTTTFDDPEYDNVGMAFVPTSADGSAEMPAVTAGETALDAFDWWIDLSPFNPITGTDVTATDVGYTVSTKAEFDAWVADGKPDQQPDANLVYHDIFRSGEPVSTAPKGKSIYNRWDAGTHLSLVVFRYSSLNADGVPVIGADSISGGKAITAWLKFTTGVNPNRAVATSGAYTVTTFGNPPADCGGLTPTLVGTTGPDTLTGTPGPDVIDGMGGDDYISGGDGNDVICDGAGADEAYGQGGDDTFVTTDAADGADTLVGGAGEDLATYATRTTAVTLTLNGAADDGAAGEHDKLLTIEDLTGGSGNDLVQGNSTPNVLDGGAGNDTLKDFPGADTVSGGAGDDTFVAPSAADSADTYDGGAGTDKASYTSRGAALTLSLNGVADDGAAGEGDNLANIENASGGGGADTITGDAGANVLLGGGGADTITDLDGADDVNGGGGADTLVEGATADGGDTLNGGPGVDQVTYAARTTAVTLTLGSGTSNDGGAGEGDWLVAVENAIGGSGADTITGTTGDNLLKGGDGNDTLKGLAGADLLYGEGDNDSLNTLDGVDGNDTANGGAGTDTATTDPGDTRVNIP